MTPPDRAIELCYLDMPKTELFPDTLHLPDLAQHDRLLADPAIAEADVDELLVRKLQ